MPAFMTTRTLIDAADGTATQSGVFDIKTLNGFSLHMVTTGTLNNATGWQLFETNAPESRDENGNIDPDTTTFDWVANTDVTFTNPSGGTSNTFVDVSDARARWYKIQWTHTGVTGTGNVSVRMHGKGEG